MLNDARRLHAADIIIKAYDPISSLLQQTIIRLEREHQVQRADVYEFFSVVRAPGKGASVLSGLKVVGPGYPFYGKVALSSGRDFNQVLVSGVCIVEQTLLDRMGLDLGDVLKVGYTTLTIADVVTAEPDRPLTFFSFGPRIFVSAGDLDALGLISKGGRIKRVVLLKVLKAQQINAVAGQLKQTALLDQEQVDTYQTAQSRIKRFLNNFFFFLKLVGLFILLVAGLGIQGTLAALLNEKRRTIAIMKTVGATSRYILLHFMGVVGLLGAMGTAMGILCGAAIQKALGWMLTPFLPTGLSQSISWTGVLEGSLLGCGVVAVFSFLPMYRIKEMRPMMIFRQEPADVTTKWPYYFSVALFLIFFLAIVWRHMLDLRFGFYFVGGISTLMLIAALLAQLLLWAAKRQSFRNLALRRAVKGLFRQGNATRAIMITLTASLAVIFANYFIEKNLDATFVQSYPQDSPNAYFVDIQPNQVQGFIQAVGRPVELYPIVRARITAVNGEPIDRRKEHQKRRDNLARVFNLTYRHHLLQDESLIKGKSLFRKDWADNQVSVLDTVVEMRQMDVGDTISFKIQGVPLNARISSIRTREQASFSPYFYFVFSEKVLKPAPQTLFAALRVAPGQLGAMQRNIVERFPNISVIDMSQTIRVFAQLMNQLSRIIRIFSLLSIAAGMLILISTIYATRAERVVEAVYYKILGAGKSFVFKVFALENILIGLFSSTLAVVMAHVGAFWICNVKLDINYNLFLWDSVLMIAITLLLVMAVGMVASQSIMKKRPVEYLREQPDG